MPTHNATKPRLSNRKIEPSLLTLLPYTDRSLMESQNLSRSPRKPSHHRSEHSLHLQCPLFPHHLAQTAYAWVRANQD